MPAVTVTAAVGANRHGSAGSGLGTGSRLAGAGGGSGYGRRRGRRSEKPGLGCGSRATERALRMLGRGRDEVNENFWPSPGLNRVQKAAEELFHYYSEFEPNLLHHLQIEFPVLKLK